MIPQIENEQVKKKVWFQKLSYYLFLVLITLLITFFIFFAIVAFSLIFDPSLNQSDLIIGFSFFSSAFSAIAIIYAVHTINTHRDLYEKQKKDAKDRDDLEVKKLLSIFDFEIKDNFRQLYSAIPDVRIELNAEIGFDYMTIALDSLNRTLIYDVFRNYKEHLHKLPHDIAKGIIILYKLIDNIDLLFRRANQDINDLKNLSSTNIWPTIDSIKREDNFIKSKVFNDHYIHAIHLINDTIKHCKIIIAMIYNNENEFMNYYNEIVKHRNAQWLNFIDSRIYLAKIDYKIRNGIKITDIAEKELESIIFHERFQLELNHISRKPLEKICVNYGLSIKGNKQQLINRIDRFLIETYSKLRKKQS